MESRLVYFKYEKTRLIRPGSLLGRFKGHHLCGAVSDQTVGATFGYAFLQNTIRTAFSEQLRH